MTLSQWNSQSRGSSFNTSFLSHFSFFLFYPTDSILSVLLSFISLALLHFILSHPYFPQLFLFTAVIVAASLHYLHPLSSLLFLSIAHQSAIAFLNFTPLILLSSTIYSHFILSFPISYSHSFNHRTLHLSLHCHLRTITFLLPQYSVVTVAALLCLDEVSQKYTVLFKSLYHINLFLLRMEEKCNK